MEKLILLLGCCVCLLSCTNAACNETREAYAFTVYDQSSAVRALVTAQSLKDAGNAKETVVVVNDHAVSPLVMDMLNTAFNAIELVTLPDWFAHSTWVLEASVRPEVMEALPKLYLWRLTQYKRLVYLGSNTMVLKSIEELFLQPGISAAPQVGSEEDFDTSVIVLTPSLETFDRLLNTSIESGFTWGDDNILNHVFKEWTALSTIYNTPDVPSDKAVDGYELTENTRVIQFLSDPGPWLDVYEEDEDVLHGPENDVDFRLRWWRTFMAVKANSPGGKAKVAAKGNDADEEHQEQVDEQLARFRGAREASLDHVRTKRAIFCCAVCPGRACCCLKSDGTCRCFCNWWTGRPHCG